jgi:hypothetical protein
MPNELSRMGILANIMTMFSSLSGRRFEDFAVRFENVFLEWGGRDITLRASHWEIYEPFCSQSYQLRRKGVWGKIMREELSVPLSGAFSTSQPQPPVWCSL